MIGDVSENGVFPTTWNGRAGGRAPRKSPITIRTFGRSPTRAASRPASALVDLVGDDLAGHGRQPGGQDALSRADLHAQAIRVEPHCLQELARGLRAAQVVLRELAAAPVGLSPPAAGPARRAPGGGPAGRACSGSAAPCRAAPLLARRRAHQPSLASGDDPADRRQRPARTLAPLPAGDHQSGNEACRPASTSAARPPAVWLVVVSPAQPLQLRAPLLFSQPPLDRAARRPGRPPGRPRRRCRLGQQRAEPGRSGLPVAQLGPELASRHGDDAAGQASG